MEEKTKEREGLDWKQLVYPLVILLVLAVIVWLGIGFSPLDYALKSALNAQIAGLLFLIIIARVPTFLNDIGFYRFLSGSREYFIGKTDEGVYFYKDLDTGRIVILPSGEDEKSVVVRGKIKEFAWISRKPLDSSAVAKICGEAGLNFEGTLISDLYEKKNLVFAKKDLEKKNIEVQNVWAKVQEKRELNVFGKLANYLGSKDPSVFYKNVFLVIVAIFMLSSMAPDVNTKVQLASIYGNQLNEVNACVVQQKIPVISCQARDFSQGINYGNLSHPLNFSETFYQKS